MEAIASQQRGSQAPEAPLSDREIDAMVARSMYEEGRLSEPTGANLREMIGLTQEIERARRELTDAWEKTLRERVRLNQVEELQSSQPGRRVTDI